ncbi:DUF6223 family protein [Streptomyces antimycoticus]|uniref:Integral membrane protein n=1 Tax=Streptomyces mordarskii TaxID=1226758 RepID=A0ABN1DCC6_9ACTN|nr:MULTISPECIES: DUF6223 family protein [Streptomyces]QTI89313.1 hypothetical protein AS97_52945 [Streptomyces sp. AgN23]WJD97232.1 DUF6223 family protein [Streptomyces antimycoticus]WTA84035.1 DUF6223 family protein [Streptomyces antimycoticus]WTB05535.1 DUF6223 family protein [Streptomyces antimycoticus]
MSVGFALAAPAAAHVSAQSAAVDAYTLTTGRLVGSAAALVALAGVVIGGLALARSAGRIGTGNGKRGAIVSLVAGLTGVVIGTLNLAVADGGPGTGNGVVGGALGLVLGLIAAVLGRLALARSNRIAAPSGRLTA